MCEDDELIRFVDSPFVLERPGVAASFIYLAVEGVIFTLLTIVMEVSKSTYQTFLLSTQFQSKYICSFSHFRNSFTILKSELYYRLQDFHPLRTITMLE